MIYLVDANILCEPTRPAPHPSVIDWLYANEGSLVVDPIILGEISIGILALPHGRKRTRFEQWFASVVQMVECLPWDAAVGLRWGRLVADLRKKGQNLPLLDGMIAATALTHDLTVATHNVRDFKRAGVKVFDPFE
jgi:toxin FitB